MTTVPLLGAALLLAVAGIGKLARPESTVIALRSAALPHHLWMVYVLALTELGIATSAIIWATPTSTTLLGFCYAGFVWFTWRLRSRQGSAASCGCFGRRATPAHPLHLVVNAVVAGACVSGLFFRPVSVLELAWSKWSSGVPLLASSVLVAVLLYLALTALPELLTAAHPDATPPRNAPGPISLRPTDHEASRSKPVLRHG